MAFACLSRSIQNLRQYLFSSPYMYLKFMHWCNKCKIAPADMFLLTSRTVKTLRHGDSEIYSDTWKEILDYFQYLQHILSGGKLCTKPLVPLSEFLKGNWVSLLEHSLAVELLDASECEFLVLGLSFSVTTGIILKNTLWTASAFYERLHEEHASRRPVQIESFPILSPS